MVTKTIIMIVVNFVTLKAAAESEPLLKNWYQFVGHTSKTIGPQLSVTKFTSMMVVIMAATKAAAKHELLFNKLAIVC
jgi:hypothetical protein